jgi:putative aldouronate transport system permease protein
MTHENKLWQWFGHIILLAVAVGCLLPFALLIVSSFTDEQTIIQNGYSFFPEKLSLTAYQYLLDQSSELLRAYGITILVTVRCREEMCRCATRLPSSFSSRCCLMAGLCRLT